MLPLTDIRPISSMAATPKDSCLRSDEFSSQPSFVGYHSGVLTCALEISSRKVFVTALCAWCRIADVDVSWWKGRHTCTGYYKAFGSEVQEQYATSSLLAAMTFVIGIEAGPSSWVKSKSCIRDR
jgi:hypothetical protein